MSGKRLVPGLFSSVSDAELFYAMLEAESEQSPDEAATENSVEATNNPGDQSAKG